LPILPPPSLVYRKRAAKAIPPKGEGFYPEDGTMKAPPSQVEQPSQQTNWLKPENYRLTAS
jgi:hypothetical protein